MSTVGIRALKQNASQVIAEVTRGTRIVVTDRGRPVAQITRVSAEPLQALVESGRIRPRRRSLAALPEPEPGELTPTLQAMRDAERY